jgi:hypothetical protein
MAADATCEFETAADATKSAEGPHQLRFRCQNPAPGTKNRPDRGPIPVLGGFPLGLAVSMMVYLGGATESPGSGSTSAPRPVAVASGIHIGSEMDAQPLFRAGSGHSVKFHLNALTCGDFDGDGCRHKSIGRAFHRVASRR